MITDSEEFTQLLQLHAQSESSTESTTAFNDFLDEFVQGVLDEEFVLPSNEKMLSRLGKRLSSEYASKKAMDERIAELQEELPTLVENGESENETIVAKQEEFEGARTKVKTINSNIETFKKLVTERLKSMNVVSPFNKDISCQDATIRTQQEIEVEEDTSLDTAVESGESPIVRTPLSSDVSLMEFMTTTTDKKQDVDSTFATLVNLHDKT